MPSRESTPPDGVEVLQVLQAVASLAPLVDHWPHLGGRVEEARMALVGHGGLTPRGLQALLEAARRWEGLDPRLRVLYAAHVQRGAVQAALWSILFSSPPHVPSGAVYGVVRSLWVDLYGYTPSIEVIPLHHGVLP